MSSDWEILVRLALAIVALGAAFFVLRRIFQQSEGVNWAKAKENWSGKSRWQIAAIGIGVLLVVPVGLWLGSAVTRGDNFGLEVAVRLGTILLFIVIALQFRRRGG